MHDLTARHKWLRAWFAEHSAELSNDPHFYCAKVAGWWVWGISLWIGGGWCNAVSERKDGLPNDKIPNDRAHGSLPMAYPLRQPAVQRVWDVRPAVTSANGVSAQAQRAKDQRPLVSNNGGVMGCRRPGGNRDQIGRVNAQVATVCRRQRTPENGH